MEFYDDLNFPVSMSDATRVQRLVQEQVDIIYVLFTARKGVLYRFRGKPEQGIMKKGLAPKRYIKIDLLSSVY